MIIWNPWHGSLQAKRRKRRAAIRSAKGVSIATCISLIGNVASTARRSIVQRMFQKREESMKLALMLSRAQETSLKNNFTLPVQRRRDGRFKLPSGMQLYVGLSTDFFVEEADEWRDEAWRIMRQRPDIVFRLLTKRASRIKECLPKDWGDGYENVLLQVTTENQIRANERLSILLDVPAKHKAFMAAPFIGEADAEKYLATGQFEEVLCGGENYDGARPCHYEWVKKLSDQCRKYDVTFDFIETGTVFVKDGKTYRIPDISQKSLTQTLRTLEEDGFVTREVFAEVHPRVEYNLTPRAYSFLPLVDYTLVNRTMRSSRQ